MIPFSTIRKRSTTAVLLPDSEVVRVYIKGAPEQIVGKCTKTFDVNGQRINFTDEEQNYIYTSVIYENFTSKGYRTIAFAYKDMTLDEFNEQKANSNNFENDSDRESLEQSLVFVGVFAL